MSVDAIPPATAATGLYNTTNKRAPKQVMDSEVFMNLLVTQLRNQDPSAPMDTNQMIAQTTQMASMEKLTNMDKTATENFSLQMRSAAAALIGREVSWKDPDGTSHSGIAGSVSFAGPIPQVTVGDATVALDVIGAINAAGAATGGSTKDTTSGTKDPGTTSGTTS